MESASSTAQLECVNQKEKKSPNGDVSVSIVILQRTGMKLRQVTKIELFLNSIYVALAFLSTGCYLEGCTHIEKHQNYF